MRSIIQDGSDDWPPTKEGAIHIKKGRIRNAFCDTGCFRSGS